MVVPTLPESMTCSREGSQITAVISRAHALAYTNRKAICCRRV